MIDPLRMIELGEAISGEVDARTLELAEDLLAEGEDPVNIGWHLAGIRNAEGRPVLALTLHAALPRTCQRCLQTFTWPLKQQTQVLVARDDDELQALDEATDDEVILGSRKIGAHELVEDELVLSLPFIPVHPGTCP